MTLFRIPARRTHGKHEHFAPVQGIVNGPVAPAHGLIQLSPIHRGQVWAEEADALEELASAGAACEGSLGVIVEDLSVVELSVRDARITVLPESIGTLMRLRKLDLGGNRMSDIPDSIGRLRHLENLNVSRNRLGSIPSNLGNLTRLHTLDLGHNALTSLPESLGRLAKLAYLDLRWNTLTRVPAWIEQLEQRGCAVLL